jgi:hypothetical protein
VFFGCGCGDAAEVAVSEAVGVAFEGDDVGVVDEPVDHRGGDDVVAEDLAPPNWDWLRFLIGCLAFDLRLCLTGGSA